MTADTRPDRDPTPPGWDYRCATVAHEGPCLAQARPLTARNAVKNAARTALTDLGITTPPGRWTPTDADLALDTAQALAAAADAAAALWEKRADSPTWITR